MGRVHAPGPCFLGGDIGEMRFGRPRQLQNSVPTYLHSPLPIPHFALCALCALCGSPPPSEMAGFREIRFGTMLGRGATNPPPECLSEGTRGNIRSATYADLPAASAQLVLRMPCEPAAEGTCPRVSPPTLPPVPEASLTPAGVRACALQCHACASARHRTRIQSGGIGVNGPRPRPLPCIGAACRAMPGG